MTTLRTLTLLASAAAALAACRSARPDGRATVQPQADATTLELRMAAMSARMDTLRLQLEALQSQNDSLRRSAGRMETEIRDRDEQIRAIRLELQRLKEIDLKPRRPGQ
jgi:chromosome segregation ATPase